MVGIIQDWNDYLQKLTPEAKEEHADLIDSCDYMHREMLKIRMNDFDQAVIEFRNAMKVICDNVYNRMEVTESQLKENKYRRLNNQSRRNDIIRADNNKYFKYSKFLNDSEMNCSHEEDEPREIIIKDSKFTLLQKTKLNVFRNLFIPKKLKLP